MFEVDDISLNIKRTYLLVLILSILLHVVLQAADGLVPVGTLTLLLQKNTTLPPTGDTRHKRAL